MKIFAVGMNYAQHNKGLLGTLLKLEDPMVLMKPDSALLGNHKPFFIPDGLGRIEYEAEVVVRICRLDKIISERFAHCYYDAVTLGIDFTARELQQKLCATGQPWEPSKGFGSAAALGDWVNMDKFRDTQTLNFHLDINGQTVQERFAGDILYKIDELIAYVSRYFILKTDGTLYTGAPAGAGPVEVNGHLEGYLIDRKALEMNCK